MPTELEREQAGLQQLRADGDAAAQREADQLQKLHHDRQMDSLAKDVYHVAAGDKSEPPAGWTRLSEHSELMVQYAERLNTTPALLRRKLHPDDSGFRMAKAIVIA